MKGISDKLKKVLISCFIISLLSGHISILGELCNIVYATNAEKNEISGFEETENITKVQEENVVETLNSAEEKITSKTEMLDSNGEKTENKIEEFENNQVYFENITKEELIEDERIEENEEITSIMDELEISEESNQKKSNMILEENNKNLEENKTIYNQLLADSYRLENIEINSDVTLDKFIKFDNESGKGSFIETTLKIDFDRQQKKIEYALVNLEVPKINELMPIEINITNISTWKYDKESGIIQIEVPEANKLANNVCLEYKIQLVYTEESYLVENLELNEKIVLGNKEEQKEENINKILEVKETQDSFVEYKAKSENSSIYKGYLKANVIAETKNETKYDVVSKAKIKNSYFVDIVEFEDERDVLVQENGQEIEFASLYKNTKISKLNYEEILSEEGYIEIYTKDRKLLGIINKETKIENENYVFDYNENVEEVIFRIVNPSKNGEIEIKSEKVILATNTFTDEQVESFKKIKSNISGKLLKQINEREIILQNVIVENEITLENTVSKMKLGLDNVDLSTELDNEVTMNVTLETDKEKYELYKNPTIEIKFPYSIEEVEIKNINLLYKNGLNLESWNVETSATEEKIIKVKLNGTQQEYNPKTIIDGTQIVIYTKIKVNRLTPNGKSFIKLKYTNEASKRNSYEISGKEAEEYEIKYVSKSGLIKSTSMQKFNKNLDVITNYNEESQIGKLDIASEKKEAKALMTIVNNYEKDISNVEIVGRIPFKGNTDENGYELNSNIDTQLVNPIATTGIESKVYYSYEEDIEKDSTLWNETVEDYTKVKSYKIVLTNGIMKKAETISFEYNIRIPENIYYNASTYGIYTVYYDYDGQEVKENSIIGLKTEEKEIDLQECQIQEKSEEIVLGTQVTRGGQIIEATEEVNEKQILRYKAVAINNSAKTLTNVKLKGKVINGKLYYLKSFIVKEYGEDHTAYEYSDDGAQEYETVSIDKLSPGESIILDYQVVVNEFENDKNEVYGEIYLTADDIEEIKVETIKNKIREAKLELRVVYAATEDAKGTTTLSSKGKFKFYTYVKNISDEKLENINLVVSLPENIEYDIDSLSYGNDELERFEEKTMNGKKVTFKVPFLEIGDEIKLYLNTSIKSLEKQIEKGTFSVVATSNYENLSYISNDYIKEYIQKETELEYSFVSDTVKDTVYHNDEITYSFKLKNIGIVNTYKMNIYTEIPYGLDIISCEAVTANRKEKYIMINQNISLTKSLIPEEEMIITLKTKVNENKFLYNQEYIETSFVVEVGNANNIITDNIKFKIDNKLKDIDEEDAGDNFQDGYDDTNENNSSTENMPEGNDTENKGNELNEDIKNNENNDEKLPVEEDINNNLNVEENKESEKIPEENNVSDKKQSVVDTDNKITKEEKKETNINIDTEQYSNNSNMIKKYDISGKIWDDKNRNGILEDSDNILSNMKVMLYTATNGKNKIDKKVAVTKTKEDGKYSFENLEVGNYIVVLEYDTKNYNVTEYKVKTAKESKNSEFISTTLTIDGKENIYAVSDLIELKDNNIVNLDAGIYLKDKFDLSLSKYISSVEIDTEKGKENITSNKSNDLVKAEIHSKQIDGAKVKVNYIIEVTNDGDIDGYATKIVDYLPKGFEFEQSENQGWYLAENGIIYNSSLINTVIERGKTKKLNLVLTKTLTGEDTGIYTNMAEIAEYTNKFKMEDTDSIYNNKKESEDDFDKVQLLISVKTGYKIFVNIILIIAIISVTAIIILIKIKKTDLKIFKKKSYR